jgi:hypothetical protein
MWPKVRLRVDAFFANLPEPVPHPPAPSIFISIIFIDLQIPLPATPFFSHLYKSPGGYTPPAAPEPRVGGSIFSYPPSFLLFADSFAQLQNSTLLFSRECGLFRKKYRGAPTNQWHRAFLPVLRRTRLARLAKSFSDQWPMFVIRVSSFELRFSSFAPPPRLLPHCCGAIISVCSF